ncbi:hypothetical protein BaRGS_00016662 [Batillaria attramentaria]|uniref:RING-type domain-containing protein n=1 Tax=Batillaria attramentaria TaxID=370345 RepID=A0ABD0KXW8_9CAEN
MTTDLQDKDISVSERNVSGGSERDSVYRDLLQLCDLLSSKPEKDFDSWTSKDFSLRYVHGVAQTLSVWPLGADYDLKDAFSEIWRLSTFKCIDDLQVSPIRLAQSGFYYDQPLEIRCFSCGVSKRNWGEADKMVALVHLHISPDCDHANFKDKRNIAADGRYVSLIPSPGQERPSEGTDEPQCPEPVGKGDSEEISERIPDVPKVEKLSPQELTIGGQAWNPTQASALSASTSCGSLSEKSTSNDDAFRDERVPTLDINRAASSGQSPRALTSAGLYNLGEDVPSQTNSPGCRDNGGQDTCDSADTVQFDDAALSSIDMNRAASPLNAKTRTRFLSFAGWPRNSGLSPTVLAEAGFYYLGSGDSVRCWYCGIILRNWRQSDDPWVTHVLFRFSCAFVLAVRGRNFITQALICRCQVRNNQVRPTFYSLQFNLVCSASFPLVLFVVIIELYVETAAVISGGNGIPAGNEQATTQIDSSRQRLVRPEVDASRSDQQRSTAGRQNPERKASPETPPVTARELFRKEGKEGFFQKIVKDSAGRLLERPTFSGSMSADGAEEYYQRLVQDSRRLRERRRCKICARNAIDTIFLPCGHLCACETCSDTLRECCLCYQRIRGTAHVYME